MRVLALVVLLALVAAATASPAGPPSAAKVAASLARKGAQDVRCIQPKPGVYICAFDYKHFCVEEELVWANGRWPGQVLASKKGNCAWAHRGPAA